MKQKQILFFLIFMVLSSYAYAQMTPFDSGIPGQENTLWRSKILIECPEEVCIEGGAIGFVISLQNIGDEAFAVNQIYLRDSDELIFTSLQNLEEEVMGGEEKTFQLIGNVPPPTRGSTLFYKVCYVINGQPECEPLPRSFILLPLEKAECVSDSECQYDEYCLKYRCYKKLKPVLGLTEYLLIGCFVLLFMILIFLIKKNKKK
jgi:hypothetical protein